MKSLPMVGLLRANYPFIMAPDRIPKNPKRVPGNVALAWEKQGAAWPVHSIQNARTGLNRPANHGLGLLGCARPIRPGCFGLTKAEKRLTVVADFHLLALGLLLIWLESTKLNRMHGFLGRRKRPNSATASSELSSQPRRIAKRFKKMSAAAWLYPRIAKITLRRPL
jgi:hypothetical protein